MNADTLPDEHDGNSTYCEQCGCRITAGRCAHGVTPDGTPEQRLAVILAAIDRGQSLYICTAYGATVIDKRTVAKFNAAGVPVLKASGGSLWRASGRKFVCIDFCRLVLQ